MSEKIIIVANCPNHEVGWRAAAQRIRYLTTVFNVILITNGDFLLRSPEIKYKECHIFHNPGIPGLQSFLFQCYCIIHILKIKAKKILLMDLSFSPIALFIFNRSVIIYGNTHIHQISYKRSRSYRHKIINFIKKARLRIKSRLIIHGMNSAKIIMSISEMLSESYVRFGVNERKITTIPMGVSIPRMKIHDIKKKRENRLNIIYAGTINPPRGSRLIFDTIKKLIETKTEQFHFLLIGTIDDDELLSIEQSTNILSILPPIQFSELEQYFLKSDVGLSFLEDLEFFQCSPPQKIFEYLAYHLPVIANKIPTHTNYISTNYNGIIINWGVDNLIDALCSLNNNPTLLMELKHNSQQYIKQFDINNIFPQIEQIIKNVS